MERDDEVNEATLATLPDVYRPVSRTRLKRLGNVVVNRLGAVGVDIEIEARPDGRLAIIQRHGTRFFINGDTRVIRDTLLKPSKTIKEGRLARIGISQERNKGTMCLNGHAI